MQCCDECGFKVPPFTIVNKIRIPLGMLHSTVVSCPLIQEIDNVPYSILFTACICCAFNAAGRIENMNVLCATMTAGFPSYYHPVTRVIG